MTTTSAEVIEEKAQYDRNIADAEDERQWLTVPVPQVSPYMRSFETMGCTTEQQLKHMRVRKIEGMGTYAKINPFACHLKVLSATRHDGTQVEPTFGEDEPVVAYVVIPQYKVKAAMNVFDQMVIAEGQYVAYCLAAGIRDVLLARFPRLSCDRETDPFTGRIPEQDFAEPQNMHASRKERECAGCGIVWRKPMDKCSRCKEARFCSKACLTNSWKEHKKVCVSK